MTVILWAHFEAQGPKIIVKSKIYILLMMPCEKCALNCKKRHSEEN